MVVFCVPGPPGAPRGLEVSDVTTRSCVLKWKAPEFDGGSPVTGYYVESSQRSYSTRWAKVGQPCDQFSTSPP